jgi:hypothetical protein
MTQDQVVLIVFVQLELSFENPCYHSGGDKTTRMV